MSSRSEAASAPRGPAPRTSRRAASHEREKSQSGGAAASAAKSAFVLPSSRASNAIGRPDAARRMERTSARAAGPCAGTAGGASTRPVGDDTNQAPESQPNASDSSPWRSGPPG